MDFDFTNMIEKAINSMIKGPRGVQIANLYRKNSNLTNFVVVYLTGFLLYCLMNPLFYHGFGWIGSGISLFIAGFWTYINTVGSLAYAWGFKPKSQLPRKPKKKVKTK